MSNIPAPSKSLKYLNHLAIASLTIAILTYLSPQVGQLGRGLRTAIPAMAISFVAISIQSPSAFIRALVRLRVALILGFLFLLQAAIRFIDVPDHPFDLYQTFFIAPLIALFIIVWIAALAELGEESVYRLRCWVLFGWCLSIAVSVPILIKYPGLARELMSGGNDAVKSADWSPYGVGTYGDYSTIGICLGPLFAVTRRMTFSWRWIALPLISLTALAVLFSTFTMAATMLTLSFVCMLLTWVIAGRGAMRMLRLMMILFPLALLPLFYVEAQKYEQTQFIVKKVERLSQGISNKGLAKGDETARGKWFMDEMESFADEPFFGFIPGVTGQRGHGHSSLSNSLVLFGLFGALLWAAALYKIFKESLNGTRDHFERYVLGVAWLVFILSGILNPIWHSPVALVAMVGLTLPARSRPVQETDSPSL